MFRTGEPVRYTAAVVIREYLESITVSIVIGIKYFSVVAIIILKVALRSIAKLIFFLTIFSLFDVGVDVGVD